MLLACGAALADGGAGWLASITLVAAAIVVAVLARGAGGTTEKRETPPLPTYPFGADDAPQLAAEDDEAAPLARV